MKLPYDYQKLCDLVLNEEILREAILERREVIRDHRDQIGDNRCWLDDHKVHCMLEDWGPYPRVLPPFEKMMEICTSFFFLRGAKEADLPSPDAILDKAKWDEDLIGADPGKLLDTLFLIQQAIDKHRSIPTILRTSDDDRDLYRVLPEKISADLRLPPEADFLGEAKSPCAGCPSFWRSHSDHAGPCNVHVWGDQCPSQDHDAGNETAARD